MLLSKRKREAGGRVTSDHKGLKAVILIKYREIEKDERSSFLRGV